MLEGVGVAATGSPQKTRKVRERIKVIRAEIPRHDFTYPHFGNIIS